MELSKEIKKIDQMLADKSLPKKMRESLAKKKNILIKQKTVLK